MLKISVIVPCYNIEKYIEKCLNSLINQTLKDIEIIVVDDGSTDKTFDIIKEYSKKDDRIIILRQNNQKQGAARNRGLDIAHGEFIAFVDGDDWVDLDYLELLYNAAIENNVNIAAASATRDYKNKVKIHTKFDEKKVYYGANDIVKGLKRNLVVHSKIFKREPIKNLRFEQNVLYEDAPYAIKAIDIENSLVTVPKAHYHYYSNPKSTMKLKLDRVRENDKISTQLQLVRYCLEHNIEFMDWEILIENHILWKIKHYIDKKVYYLFGIKLFSRLVPFDDEKIFIILDEYSDKYELLKKDIENAFSHFKIIFSKNPKENKKAYIVFANKKDFIKAHFVKSRFREFSDNNDFSIQKYTNKKCKESFTGKFLKKYLES